ncbi:hypothetical protein [Endozoicomonas sp. 8E]|uniref:hypothetical protein n=1 Tax=Endozoicomonas sp. 8E TaxID=3035692 RepID=UPI0029390052|nr:hypothetical protein [Endozoicomonas sp. 8E]WOG27020.1 hypothetical protein P6910_21080 [Endozoicomonas sp. 8E]
MKNDWNLSSTLFKSIEEQTTRTLTQRDHLFAAITMTPGSGYKQQHSRPSESSGQQAQQSTTKLTNYFTHLVHSDCDDGNSPPRQHSHTLGLNCYLYPCHGVCQLRPSSDSRVAERPLDSLENSTGQTDSINDDVSGLGNLPLTTDDWLMVSGLLSLRSRSPFEETQQTSTDSFQLSPSPLPLSRPGALQARDHVGQSTRDVNIVGNDRQQPWGKNGPKACGMPVVGKDGLQRPCGKICKNANALSSHKSKVHSGQKTCSVTIVEKDGQQRPCGMLCKNSLILSQHKKRSHTGQQTCVAIVLGEDGQQRPCGQFCKNGQVLSDHKRRTHSEQQTCDLFMVGEDGRQLTCGRVCKSKQALYLHKRKDHSEQQTCDLTVVGEDGQQQRCGTVSKNIHALESHKNKYHSGQKTCEVQIVREDGQQQPCGRICKHAQELSTHKRKKHSGQKTCEVQVVGEDRRQRPCGKICKNAKALSDHKRMHRKHKPVDVNQDIIVP